MQKKILEICLFDEIFVIHYSDVSYDLLSSCLIILDKYIDNGILNKNKTMFVYEEVLPF